MVKICNVNSTLTQTRTLILWRVSINNESIKVDYDMTWTIVISLSDGNSHYELSFRVKFDSNF